MSLEAIRKLRLQRAKPGLVWLVIGPAPKWLEDDATVIRLAPDAAPEFMDWRPVIGLTLAVFQTAPLADLALRAIDAAAAAGAVFFGAADHSGTYPMVEGAGPEHHLALRRAWEHLCRS